MSLQSNDNASAGGGDLRIAIIPALYAIVVLFSFTQYGITWDESVQARYGELALRYFTSGFRDHSVNQLRDLRLYGPMFETIAAAIYKFAPAAKYEIRHLLIAITGIASVVGTGYLCKNTRVNPMLGQLFLVLNPQFYGHTFNNSKDIPMACAAVFTMLAFARVLGDDPSPWNAIPLGLSLGAAMAIRSGAIILVAIAVAAILITRRWRAFVPLAISLPIAWAVMIAFWPWAHENPILNPLIAMRIASRFPAIYPVLFEGRQILSNQLPVRYLIEMLAITTPIATLLFALIGIGRVARRLDPPGVLAGCWLIFPVVLFCILRPNVYDGIRHFLFIIPAMAVLAAIGISVLPRYAVIVAFIPLISMIRLHPYESTYYNAFVDARNFDTDYWASSYREAAMWLRAHRCPARPTRVLVAATALSRECLTHYLDPRDFFVARTVDHVAGELPREFDYYVATTRYGFANNYPNTPVTMVIGRDGVPFTVIRGACAPVGERGLARQ